MSALTYWVQNTLADSTVTLQPLNDCASTRRYYRVQQAEKTFIAMDSPPATEKNSEFIAIASLLKKSGFYVPEVIARDLKQGFLVISDLGDSLFSKLLTNETVDYLYKRALDTLLELQTRPLLSAYEFPRYDADFVLRELNIFKEWYLLNYCKLELNTTEEKQLVSIFDLLLESVLEQPTVFMHRDYHSQNLMLVNGTEVGILDFQDAVRGPITYDLVSLLRDCYIAWPQQQVYDWMNGYYECLLAKGLLPQDNFQQFVKWFDWMGLQRHLKAVGLFVRLSLRDNKVHYLQHIPQTLKYIHEMCGKYKQLEGLTNLMRSDIEV